MFKGDFVVSYDEKKLDKNVIPLGIGGNIIMANPTPVLSIDQTCANSIDL